MSSVQIQGEGGGGGLSNTLVSKATESCILLVEGYKHMHEQRAHWLLHLKAVEFNGFKWKHGLILYFVLKLNFSVLLCQNSLSN